MSQKKAGGLEAAGVKCLAIGRFTAWRTGSRGERQLDRTSSVQRDVRHG